LPEDLPPLRLLLVWDNLTGHKMDLHRFSGERFGSYPASLSN
jgi:hypothetical protein